MDTRWNIATAMNATITSHHHCAKKSDPALSITVITGRLCFDCSTTCMIFGTTADIRTITITMPTQIITIG